MFLALRELAFARGRFSLMGLVIGLIAILMVLLSGLSSGLVNDGVSGLKSLPVSAFAFDEGTKTDNAFSRSVVDTDQLAAWRGQPDVAEAELMGTSIMNAVTDDGQQVDLTMFGVEPDGFLAPEAADGGALDGPAGIVVSESLRGEGIDLGTVITLDRINTELEVVGFTEGQATFGHVDIAYLPLATWQLIAAGQAPDGAAPTDAHLAALDFDQASVIALQGAEGSELAVGSAEAFAAGDAAATTTTLSLEESFNASPGYQAETMTLSMIQVFLYAIGALVVGAFFTVWTIQRGHELAVLRALGASAGYLLRDGLAQASILLVSFTALGVAAGVGLGSLMPEGMPFALEAQPIAVASALTILLGLVGAAVAVLRVTRIEPISALGGNR
ncbi:ABC transporter permease [Citricoccus sp.]|uniref:ABC transporter permease n=1 Tax=Citricoccus sp. TaxID=1978372 RepID=UPI00261E7A38|nr:ABC transporter permease [Citricoccus sp.]HRO31196.1 ABC transporter permease [Citricoccus sp.]HRO94325.1 ABC transporter permease [Citricoccus sp.]